MLHLKVILLSLLINPLYSYETIKSIFASETPIHSPTDYAQTCFQTGDFPILTSMEENTSINAQSIPLGQLTLEAKIDTHPETIILKKNKGTHQVKCSLVSLKLTHYNTAARYVVDHPLYALGTYAALYLMPSLISTPIITTSFVAGAGYFFWQNKSKLSTIDRSLDGIVQAAGLQTTLGQALQNIGNKNIEPQIKLNGDLHFQAYIPNGIIPGQYLYVDMEVTPISESK